MKNPAEEIVQIVDRQNRVTGACPRATMRTQRLIHRATYILVFNARNELFVQKRTMTKDIYPGHWDIAAGGVVLAGESYEESAERELSEELGISGIPLTFLFDSYFEDCRNRVWGRIFRCMHDGPFRLQAEEIDHGRFLTVDQVLELGKTEPFTPDGLEILKKIHSDKAPPSDSAVLFLHGLDSSSRGTKGRYFADHFPSVIAPDFTGSLQERLRALEKICTGHHRLTLIGSSFGGLMATCYAIEHPRRIDRLILLAPALNFSEFVPPKEPADVRVQIYIGKDDTVTPAELVVPAANASFRSPEIILTDDDHMLHKTFFALDWARLLA